MKKLNKKFFTEQVKKIIKFKAKNRRVQKSSGYLFLNNFCTYKNFYSTFFAVEK